MTMIRTFLFATMVVLWPTVVRAEAENEPNAGQRRAKLLKRFDLDGNGQLDKNERAAARDAREKRRADGSGRRRGGKRDPEHRAKILEQFDADGNGQLDVEERTAARKARGRQSNDRNRGKRHQGRRRGKTGSLKGKNDGQLGAPRGRDLQSGKRLGRAEKRRQAGGPGANRRKSRKRPGR